MENISMSDFKPYLPLKKSVFGIDFKRLKENEELLSQIINTKFGKGCELHTLEDSGKAVCLNFASILNLFYGVKEMDIVSSGDSRTVLFSFTKIKRVGHNKSVSDFKVKFTGLPSWNTAQKISKIEISLSKGLYIFDKPVSGLSESHTMEIEVDMVSDSASVSALEALDMADTLVSNKLRNILQELLDSPLTYKNLNSPLVEKRLP